MVANTQIVSKPRLLAGAEPPNGVPVKLLRVAKTAETFGAVMTTLVSEPSSQLKAWKHFAVNLERDFGTNDTALESATGAAFNNSLQDSEVVPAGSPASTIQKDTLVEKIRRRSRTGPSRRSRTARAASLRVPWSRRSRRRRSSNSNYDKLR